MPLLSFIPIFASLLSVFYTQLVCASWPNGKVYGVNLGEWHSQNLTCEDAWHLRRLTLTPSGSWLVLEVGDNGINMI